MYGYCPYGQLTNETVSLLCAPAPLRETLIRTTDPLGRSTGFSLSNSDYAATYGYDTYGRFSAITSSVSSVSFVVNYSHLPNSDFLSGRSLEIGNSLLVVGYSYEPHRDLTTTVANLWDGSPISRFDYDNDSLARRTGRVDNGSVTNDFSYNVRSEVIGALMGTNTYSYAFDPIGNRLAATNNANIQVYLTNPLNQYTNIQEGAAQSVPLYDLDGNMTATGDGWQYVWNAENRLILASNAQRVVSYAYDHQGRMVGKTVDEVACQYLWDGYNIVAGVGTVATNWFIWGLDLSGTLQGAGGVGGLLAEIQDGQPYFAGFDANGNVTEYVATNGVTAARYEYSPFGEITVHSGDLADTFTHSFSTKPWCMATGLSEYEKRKYGPWLGRWMSRDPRAEKGGLGLQTWCLNAQPQYFDPLGTVPSRWGEPSVLPPATSSEFVSLPGDPSFMHGAAGDLFYDLEEMPPWGVQYPRPITLNEAEQLLRNALLACCPKTDTPFEKGCCRAADCPKQAADLARSIRSHVERERKDIEGFWGSWNGYSVGGWGGNLLDVLTFGRGASGCVRWTNVALDGFYEAMTPSRRAKDACFTANWSTQVGTISFVQHQWIEITGPSCQNPVRIDAWETGGHELLQQRHFRRDRSSPQ